MKNKNKIEGENEEIKNIKNKLNDLTNIIQYIILILIDSK